MIRCCSKFFNPLPSNSGGQVFLSRIYVASRSSDFNQKRYSSGENQPPRRLRKLFYTTVGLTLIGVGGVVVYAKSDPKFRKVLDSYVPGSDKFIRVIYQEDGSINLDFAEQLSSLQDKVLSIPSDIYKQLSGTSSEKPSSVLPKTKELRSEEVAKPTPKPAVDTSRKGVRVYEVSASELKAVGDEALKIYTELIDSMKEKADEIIEAIDKLEDSPDPSKAWKEIRGKMDEHKKFTEEVDNKFKEADDKMKNFLSLKKKTPDISEDLKSFENELIKTKEKAEDLKHNKLEASTKYLTKIEDGLKRSSEELSTLFPGYMPGSKRIKLGEDDLDLFLYYAFHKLTYYQKELEKMDNIIKQKIDKAIKSKDDIKAIDAAVEAKLEDVKRNLKEDYDKKMLELKKGCEEDVQGSLKRAEQVHLDILNDQLALKEKEVERKLLQKMEEKVMEEKVKLQVELADMTGRMQGLNEAIAKRALQDQKAQTSQALWSAAQALHNSLKHGDGEEIKPLAENIQAIKNSSAKGDDLVETVLATIPSVAVERGVYPQDSLRERFLKVEEVAWKVAGVPEGGASLPKLLIAWLQSLLVIKASEPIPSGELNNEPFDPSSLNNYDILQRARYYIDRGDFEQALKYMNLLKGGARAVSSDWIREAIVLLETEQAAHLLLAHASASGMIYS